MSTRLRVHAYKDGEGEVDDIVSFWTRLREGVHNDVHDTIGGNMRTPYIWGLHRNDSVHNRIRGLHRNDSVQTTVRTTCIRQSVLIMSTPPPIT
jgi:hypothetical protein